MYQCGKYIKKLIMAALMEEAFRRKITICPPLVAFVLRGAPITWSLIFISKSSIPFYFIFPPRELCTSQTSLFTHSCKRYWYFNEMPKFWWCVFLNRKWSFTIHFQLNNRSCLYFRNNVSLPFIDIEAVILIDVGFLI